MKSNTLSIFNARKFQLISTAICLLFVSTVTQADAKLYGAIRFDVYKNGGTTNPIYHKRAQSSVSEVTLGVKGSEQTNAGIKAGYEIRFVGAHGQSNGGAKFNTSRANLYLEDDFGRVTFGLQTNPAEYTENRTEFTMHSGMLSVSKPVMFGAGIVYSKKYKEYEFFAGLGNVDSQSNKPLVPHTATSAFVAANTSYAKSLYVAYNGERFAAAGSVNKGKDMNNKGMPTSWAVSSSAKVADNLWVGARYSKFGTLKGYSVGGSYQINTLWLGAQYETRKMTGLKRQKSASVSAYYELGGNAYVQLGYVKTNEAAAKQYVGSQVKVRYGVWF